MNLFGSAELNKRIVLVATFAMQKVAEREGFEPSVAAYTTTTD